MSGELGRSMLKLYYLIKKAHLQALPPKMRDLGDRFVKQEFRAHMRSTDPKYLQGFVEKWVDYYQELAQVKTVEDLGRNIDKSLLQHRFSPEQQEALAKIKAGL